MENIYTSTHIIEQIDYIMTIIVGTSLVCLPFFIVIFYCYNFERL